MPWRTIPLTFLMNLDPLKLFRRSDFQDGEIVNLRVRYADTDTMGVVYHANYFMYFESGRAELIRNLWKPYAQMEREGILLPIIEAAARYLQAARYDDWLTVGTKVVYYTGARLQLGYAIFGDSANAPIVIGSTAHCFMDQNRNLRRMPGELLKRLVTRQPSLIKL
ncbi:MAG: thioesterase family protein [bacterium]